MEFQCRVIVQHRQAAAALWKTFCSKLNATSGEQQKLFALPPESAFGFRSESRSASTGDSRVVMLHHF
jgi:hypothetical protein